jgi:hypothetical protein
MRGCKRFSFHAGRPKKLNGADESRVGQNLAVRWDWYLGDREASTGRR